MKKILLIFLVLFTYLNLNAQFVNGQSGKVLLKGTITDKTKSDLMNVKITFKNEQGKEISTVSNSETGKYELLLDGNTAYDVFINSKEIIRLKTKYTTPNTDKYTEVNKDFSVQTIEPGAVISLINNAFDDNNINNKAINELDEVKKILRFNRTIYINVYLLSDNTNSQKSSSRLSVIKDYFTEWKRFKSKIDEIKIYGKYQDILPTGDANDILIIISKVKDPFGG